MSDTWLVGFHGGNDDTSINNLAVFTDSNTPATPLYALGPTPATQPHPGALPALRELRAFVPNSDGSLLYVVNAYKDFSQILTFTGTPAGSNLYAFESGLSDPKLVHPFAIVSGWSGAMYISNQDDSKHPVVYVDSGKVHTFSTASVAEPRGLAFDGTYIYVADAGSNTVTAYGTAGGNACHQWSVKEPVHLMYDGGTHLYIGSEKDNAVLVADLSSPGNAPQTLIFGGNPSINHTGGLALVTASNTTTLYVCSRLGYQVLAYPLTFSGQGVPQWDGSVSVFLDEKWLPDNPEFIACIGNPYG